jgi:hypothetical protein
MSHQALKEDLHEVLIAPLRCVVLVAAPLQILISFNNQQRRRVEDDAVPA